MNPVRTLAVVALLLSLSACQSGTDTPEDFEASIAAFASEREDLMRSEAGWLNLVGMIWLPDDGTYTMGSGRDNDIVFPASLPESIGTLRIDESGHLLTIAEGSGVTIDGNAVSEMMLLPDEHEVARTVLHAGTIRCFLIKRDGRFGFRLKDLESAEVAAFQGIERFSTSAAHRVVATLTVDPDTLDVPTVLGTMRKDPSPGVLSFTVAGETVTLRPAARGDQYFFVFGDATNGRSTYGGGRFLYSDAVNSDGETILDFNRAYNPPCAFSAYSTCPLPAKGNTLSIPIEAGEKVFESTISGIQDVHLGD